jgi:hypothetical protein
MHQHMANLMGHHEYHSSIGEFGNKVYVVVDLAEVRTRCFALMGHSMSVINDLRREFGGQKAQEGICLDKPPGCLAQAAAAGVKVGRVGDHQILLP